MANFCREKLFLQSLNYTIRDYWTVHDSAKDVDEDNVDPGIFWEKIYGSANLALFYSATDIKKVWAATS